MSSADSNQRTPEPSRNAPGSGDPGTAGNGSAREPSGAETPGGRSADTAGRVDRAAGAVSLDSAESVEAAESTSALRADIRRLGDLLGETLVRQEGAELLDLVERVRALTRSNGEEAAELLGETDLETATKLVRAFSTYFHLANVTEQVHRGRELRQRRAADGGMLARTADMLKDADPAHLANTARHLSVRPVFTAHPTEAARRSVLTKLRRRSPSCWRSRTGGSWAGPSAAAPICGWPRTSTWSGRPTSCASPVPSPRTRRATPSTTWTSCTAAPSATCWRTWRPSWSAPAHRCRPAPAP